MKNLFVLVCLVALASVHCGGEATDNNTDQTNNASDMAVDQNQADMSDMNEDQAGDMKDMPNMEEMTEDLLKIPPGPWDISKNGPYNVGYQTTKIIYKAKPELADRELEVVVWYPTLVKGGRLARYLRLLTRQGIYLDAPIAPEGQFPVLVFSHGNSSLAEQSYFMTEYFASHGWVVVAPYHTGNSVRDNEGSINYRSALYRPQDISAILDWLEALPEGFVIKDRITKQVALSGHSFGGYTTLASAGSAFRIDEIKDVCTNNPPNQKLCDAFSQEADLQVFRDAFVDTRIKVAIPQTPAGAFFFGDGLKDIKIPTMLMTGARDRSLPNEEEGDPIWQNLPADGHHIRLDFPQGGHFTFSNMCELFPTLDQVANDGCNETFIPADRALPIIRQYALAFAQYHLLADMRHKALLEGEEQPWKTDVTFSKK